MKQALKHMLPPRLLRALQRKYYERAQLKFTLVSGVHVEVLSHVDWCLYNDIFVDGEYDKPIEMLVSLVRGDRDELRILDLGSNVGFFLLRVLDRLAVEGLHPKLFVGAVEPDPLNIAEMKRRVGEQEAYRAGGCQLNLVRGLAGKREGYAAFEQTHSYHAGSILHSSSCVRSGCLSLNYVDVSTAFGSGRWDLIKCDIEGSEEDFVTGYPDVLSHTEIFVVEVHHGVCLLESICARLQGTGLKYAGALAERGANSVHMFTRK